MEFNNNKPTEAKNKAAKKTENPKGWKDIRYLFLSEDACNDADVIPATLVID